MNPSVSDELEGAYIAGTDTHCSKHNWYDPNADRVRQTTYHFDLAGLDQKSESSPFTSRDIRAVDQHEVDHRIEDQIVTVLANQENVTWTDNQVDHKRNPSMYDISTPKSCTQSSKSHDIADAMNLRFKVKAPPPTHHGVVVGGESQNGLQETSTEDTANACDIGSGANNEQGGNQDHTASDANQEQGGNGSDPPVELSGGGNACSVDTDVHINGADVSR